VSSPSRTFGIQVWPRLCALALALAVLGPPALAPAQPRAAERPSSPPEYIIGRGDVLQVFVWKEPDLTRDVTVRIDGKITMPLLGDVVAAGHTPQQLGVDLGKALARFLAEPNVTVGVAQANSARWYVIGQVARPGAFPLTGRLTVLQGLALAGGLKEFANADEILIIREESGKQTFVPINYKKLAAGQDIAQNVLLREGDTIVVP
jgi:polysaccharide biosynthesis/export protein